MILRFFWGFALPWSEIVAEICEIVEEAKRLAEKCGLRGKIEFVPPDEYVGRVSLDAILRGEASIPEVPPMEEWSEITIRVSGACWDNMVGHFGKCFEFVLVVGSFIKRELELLGIRFSIHGIGSTLYFDIPRQDIGD